MSKTAQLSEAAQNSNLLLSELRSFMSQSVHTQTPLRADTLEFGNVVVASFTPNQTEIFLELPKENKNAALRLDQVEIRRAEESHESNTAVVEEKQRVRIMAFRNKDLACATLGGAIGEPVKISAEQIRSLVSEIKECLGVS